MQLQHNEIIEKVDYNINITSYREVLLQDNFEFTLVVFTLSKFPIKTHFKIYDNVEL